MVLLVDMDNCITDTYILDYINEFLGTNYSLDGETNFYLQYLVGDRYNEFLEFISNKNLYGDCPLIKDCYRVLKELNKIYDLYIVTSYIWKDLIDISGDNLKNKYNYLKEMLPFIDSKQYIFTSNKTLIRGDIMIDDRLDNMSGVKHKILFDAWHNRDLVGDFVRVKGWRDIYNILKDGEFNE